jgi:simple sugar transport system ATP-binding protein
MSTIAKLDGPPILEARNIGKTFGSVRALHDVSCSVSPGEVLCVLGDNGAGKSTFIKILAGAHEHSEGEMFAFDEEIRFRGPKDALDKGIATVFQTLATVPLMSVWRNFFLGSEITTGWGPFRRLDVKRMREITKRELANMGIDLRDVDQSIGTLSGGERQSVAIARAVYQGAKLIILDEPTAALGVKQAGVVLKYVAQARDRGLGVVFISHNPQHAYAVGDKFLLLNRGTALAYAKKSEITLQEMTHLMAGGAELEAIAHELERPTIQSQGQ